MKSNKTIAIGMLIFALLLGMSNALAQDTQKITIPAEIRTQVVTNTVIPKQYWFSLSYSSEGRYWRDEKPAWITEGCPLCVYPSDFIRDNPDVRIEEIRKIKTLSFTFEGKEYNLPLSDELISSKKLRRTVKEEWVEEQ